MSISVKDLRFALYDVLDYESHFRGLGLADPPSRELFDAIIEECARFAERELEPLNAIGDREGCRLVDGEVHAPPGFKESYEIFVEGGWAGLSGDPEYGGQGLPDSCSLVIQELMNRANMAWTMYAGLSRGVVEALENHGSTEQKSAFLPHLLTGEWTGTMCLTEPHAGSDVGLAKTKAEPLADGAYAISGTKIFISAGDHDLAENIVHLVLARLPDSPSGTRGISMFLVPKFDLDGQRNAVVCGGLEEKMGIHGNATCVLHFDQARGYLVGASNEGMRNMFTMMNAARIMVGLQGVSCAQAAFERAAEYATERLQMRSLSGPKQPDSPADPIIVHPDVRRMLLSQKAVIEGGRVLVYLAAQQVDRAEALEGTARTDADALLDFLTPIVKGFLTEAGFESVNHAVQVFGGHGFIRETGVEQQIRDMRITTIYEGTTGIQGLDLLGRKVLQTQGAGLTVFLGMLQETAAALGARSELAPLGAELERLADEWGALALSIGGRAADDVEEVGAGAVDFLFYSGYAALAYSWGRIALAATRRIDAGDGDGDYLAAKIATARFFFGRMLPRAASHKAAIEAGAQTLMSVSADALASS